MHWHAQQQALRLRRNCEFTQVIRSQQMFRELETQAASQYYHNNNSNDDKKCKDYSERLTSTSTMPCTVVGKTWSEINGNGTAKKHPLKYPIRLSPEGTSHRCITKVQHIISHLHCALLCTTQGRTCADTSTLASVSRGTAAPSTIRTVTSAAAQVIVPHNVPTRWQAPAEHTSTR